uniref:Uncharacterized protein n=1 Tax=Candidatus Kentrum sp. UNK TaxID=2126344 RepID=A0A451A608_9GAMM|nr:MAG: hypothetical protein BECKUNK1418G_GA0071005_101739 [Candidatus Kentron sp. UNK]VFK69109.1 MAG: hypothetical protein BECKUNK1418H_GA0071006_101030 [Candidatus Kentron sp. UNK]
MVDARSDPPYGPESGLLFHSKERGVISLILGIQQQILPCYRGTIHGAGSRSRLCGNHVSMPG